jgi:Asp-tRNA(Asn)/Glu-tRNA(Gln) amidotransferase A subunit family amidase
MPPVESLTVESIGAGFDRGDFKASDVVSACLERIALLEPFLNAFITINMRMLEDAASIDAEIAAGGCRGALHGVPVLIKDNMNQVGSRTTAGWAGELHPQIAEHCQRMIEVVEALGARTVKVVFSETDFNQAWDARVFFAGCNSYLGGVDAYLAALGGANPASRGLFAARAGFEIGLATAQRRRRRRLAQLPAATPATRLSCATEQTASIHLRYLSGDL